MRAFVAVVILLSTFVVPVSTADDDMTKWRDAGLRAYDQWYANATDFIHAKEAALRQNRRMRKSTAVRKAIEDLTAEILELKKRRLAMPRWQKPKLTIERMKPGDVGYFFNFGSGDWELEEFYAFQILGPNSLLMRARGELMMGTDLDTSSISDKTNFTTPLPFVVQESTTYKNPLGSTNTVMSVRAVSPTIIEKFVESLGADILHPKSYRQWQDASKKFSTEACLVNLDDEIATLEKKDGSTLKVSLDKLSRTDREFAIEQLGIVK